MTFPQTAQTPAKIQRKSILVVDDESIVCHTLEELLTGDGHSVFTTTSASTAIELYKSRRFDLIFLDYYLPEMTGDKVIGIIRRANPRQSIVLISGGRPYPPRGAADHIIPKPLTCEVVRDAVAKFA